MFVKGSFDPHFVVFFLACAAFCGGVFWIERQINLGRLTAKIGNYAIIFLCVGSIVYQVGMVRALNIGFGELISFQRIHELDHYGLRLQSDKLRAHTAFSSLLPILDSQRQQK